MNFALTTRWNAGRHTSGEEMLEEILELGFTHVELGYDTRLDLVPGIRNMVEQGAVKIDSLHNFCPLPMGSGRGHPEIYTFASGDRRIREKAIQHTSETLRFAAELGARVIVVHSGNVEMKHFTMELVRLAETGQQFTPRFEKMQRKVQDVRERKSRRQFPHLMACLEQMMPVLEETGVQMALEVLPTWEAFPTEIEFERIFDQFGSKRLRYWHDIGHSQIRENLGFIRMERWLERLEPHLAGFHLHDVAPPGRDHVMPPDGHIDFERYTRFVQTDALKVIEPTNRTPAHEVARALQFFRETFDPAFASTPPPEESRA